MLFFAVLTEKVDKRPQKATQGKTRGKAAAAPTPLPERQQQLLDLFVAVDCAYCFLVKNSIPPRVANLQVGVLSEFAVKSTWYRSHPLVVKTLAYAQA